MSSFSSVRCRTPASRMMRTRVHAAAPEKAGEPTIRRRPPFGIDRQPSCAMDRDFKHCLDVVCRCGPVDFKVQVDESNKPVNILEEIVWYKSVEIEKWRVTAPPMMVRAAAMRAPPARDFRAAILNKLEEFGKPGLIAEVKKASPSKGVIQPDFDPVRIAQGYERGGAACLSVLTDAKFFQGSFDNLKLIRAAGVQCPLLCKEFIVDAYQIMKARANGADAVLLIAAVLPNNDLAYFIKAASSLGMQCLVEVHSEAELQRVLEVDGIDGQILGINNRDLGTFEVDLNLTKQIMDSAAGQEVQKRGIVMVGESGIFTPEHVQFVQDSGCRAILVGESIVKQGDQEAGVKTLLSRN